MSAAAGWAVSRSAPAFADLGDEVTRSVTFFDVDAPMLVGRGARPSGGGAVWLAPGEVVWADVVVPRADPLWDDDVSRATWWLGEVWAGAVADLGVSGAEVHRGGMTECTRWCRDVCFGGLGPGEVHVAQRKVVGIAQRRRRAGALFQCAVNLAWDPAPLVGALGLPAEAVAELAEAVIPLTGVSAAAVESALLAHLPA